MSQKRHQKNPSKPNCMVQPDECLSRRSCVAEQPLPAPLSPARLPFSIAIPSEEQWPGRQLSHRLPGPSSTEQPKPPPRTLSCQGLWHLVTARAAVSRSIIITRWHQNIGHMFKLAVGQAATWARGQTSTTRVKDSCFRNFTAWIKSVSPAINGCFSHAPTLGVRKTTA